MVPFLAFAEPSEAASQEQACLEPSLAAALAFEELSSGEPVTAVAPSLNASFSASSSVTVAEWQPCGPFAYHRLPSFIVGASSSCAALGQTELRKQLIWPNSRRHTAAFVGMHLGRRRYLVVI